MSASPLPEDQGGPPINDKQSFPKSLRYSLGIALIFMIILFALFVWQPKRLFYWAEYKVANQVVARVELFRREHGQLPESLRDVGLSDPNMKVFYQKKSNQDYEVWFGTDLGESAVYESAGQRWR